MPDLSPQELASQRRTSQEYMPQTMTVLRQSTTQTPIGSKTGPFEPYLEDIPCDIVAETIGASETQRGTLTTWTVYTDIVWDINTKDRLLDNLGRQFEVNNVVEAVGSDEYTSEQVLGCSRIA